MTVPNDVYQRLTQLEAQVRYLSERTGIPLPDFALLSKSTVPPEVQQLIASGNKIGAIKAYREASGCDLGTAKKFVDSYDAR